MGSDRVANSSEAFAHLLVRGFVDSDAGIPALLENAVRGLKSIE